MATKKELQNRWIYLYKEYLPMLAKARDEAQPRWSVVLDHCFARIILDNSVGVDKPWPQVLKSPAYKNMSEAQLQTAIALAEQIAQGDANLVELDERSLQLRGKPSKKREGRDGVMEEDDDGRGQGRS
jgi:methylated-DNA-[protein]-cysteine S-methyltransferase